MTAGILAVSAATAAMIWWTSLALAAVVLVVVVILLHSVLRAAGRIHAGVADIWTVGKQIAGNTVQVATLAAINRTAANIVGAAGGIHDGLRRIEGHASNCSGCPMCILRRRAGGSAPDVHGTSP